VRVVFGGFFVVFVDMDFGSFSEDGCGEFAEKDPTGRYVRVWILVIFFSFSTSKNRAFCNFNLWFC
jgi:hypothetical protein